jgi:hypothetical protein
VRNRAFEIREKDGYEAMGQGVGAMIKLGILKVEGTDHIIRTREQSED